MAPVALQSDGWRTRAKRARTKVELKLEMGRQTRRNARRQSVRGWRWCSKGSRSVASMRKSLAGAVCLGMGDGGLQQGGCKKMKWMSVAIARVNGEEEALKQKGGRRWRQWTEMEE